MSWAKLAGSNKLSASQDSAASGRTSPGRRESSPASMRGLLKKASASSRKGSGDSDSGLPEGNAWKNLKRMSVATEGRSSERLTLHRLSDVADVAKNTSGVTPEPPVNEKGMRKLSSAFKKIGKAQIGLASVLA